MKRRCACCGEEFEADGGLQEALDLFRRVHGREASGAEELESWLADDNMDEQTVHTKLQ